MLPAFREACCANLMDIVLSAFTEGFVAGLGTLVFIGPVLFTLLNASLQGGWRLGVFVATGIVVSDVACIFSCFYGAIPFVEQVGNQLLISRLGAAILFALGLKFIWKPSKSKESTRLLTGKTAATAFLQGFLVNFVNPFVFLVWIGLITHAKNRHVAAEATYVFLLATLLAIYATDLTKAFLAQKIKHILSANVLKWCSRIAGILLIAFGIRLLL
jgi:threonine/homoserine/homoserine lactone efflux protein